jgi:site-specific DNA-methyltransferase (adenine-specific)
MFSFAGDTVLDPFLGSGTTCLAAMNLNRNSIGYEVNQDFLPVIKEKLNSAIKDVIPACRESFLKKAAGQAGMTEEGCRNVETVFQKKKSIDFSEEILELPYVFKDPVKFDKKIDPKKLRFGSRIDHSDRQRETYYSVKEIKSPELVVLENGLEVRLIGVRENAEMNGKAIQFLKEKLEGEKVFLKFDTTKHDENGTLLCYLYLKNKTFINAHLIKSRLAQVDTGLNFKYKSRFIDLQNNSQKDAF